MRRADSNILCSEIPHMMFINLLADICRVRRVEPIGELQQMPKKVTRTIRPWTKEDIRSLKAHSKARTPVEKVSKEMKRTVGALRRRAGILGIGLGANR